MLMKSFYNKIYFSAILMLLVQMHTLAQDSLSLDDIPSQKVLIKDAFNGGHIVFNQSTNMVEARRLDLVFDHRFGKLDEGAFNAFGLDQAFIRIGFEYGIKDWLTAGIGRTSLGRNFDLFLKHRPLVQSTGGIKNSPVSIIVVFNTAFSSTDLRRENQIHQNSQLKNQLVYTLQSAVSRQFSPILSAQLTCTMVHKNKIYTGQSYNDVYALAAGLRAKVSESIHVVGEYNALISDKMSMEFSSPPVAVGIDVVAGGHVFNMHFANTPHILVKDIIRSDTPEEFWKGGMRFGFTIRRSFLLKKESIEKVKH